jgi:hypothetical protein
MKEHHEKFSSLESNLMTEYHQRYPGANPLMAAPSNASATAEGAMKATAAQPASWAVRLLPSCGGATRCVGLAGHRVLGGTSSGLRVMV